MTQHIKIEINSGTLGSSLTSWRDAKATAVSMTAEHFMRRDIEAAFRLAVRAHIERVFDPNADMLARDEAGASKTVYEYGLADLFANGLVIFESDRKPGVKPAIDGLLTVDDGKPRGIGWNGES